MTAAPQSTAPHGAPDAPGRWLIPSLSAANFAIGMGAFVVIGVLTPIAESLSLSAAEAGWAMTAYALAYAVASPLLVAATGRMERRAVLTIGLSIFTAAAALAAFADHAATLFAARVLTAFGAGMVTPVAAGVAAAASAPERRGKALAAAFFGLTLAQVLGVPVGAWIGYAFGWQAVFAVTAALGAVSLLLVRANVPKAMAFQATSPAALVAALKHMRTLFAILFTVLITAAIYAFYTYTAPVLEARMGFARDGVSLFLMVFGFGAVAGNLLGGALTDRIGAFATLALVGATQVLFLPFYSFLPVPEWVLFAHVLVWSTLGWCFAASQQTRLISLAPERANVMLALNAASIYVGVSLGSWIGGATIALAGLDALGFVGAGVAVLALIALYASK